MNKVHKINSADKGSLHQLFQGIFFALYIWNSVPVDGTYITLSVVDIEKEFPFTIDLTPERSKGGYFRRTAILVSL